MNTILHCDMNGFYASVECLYHPEYAGMPLAVGGDVENRHGIILAKNEEAKKYKIKTAETLREARDKCPHLVIVPPNYDKYISVSSQFRKMLLEYSGRVEPFGLDENWVDLGPYSSIDDGRQVADELRARIIRELGITASIGVSYNKIFAKLGSDMQKPDATTIIPSDSFKDVVWPLPASDLLMVGPATTRKLAYIGITTIGDIATADVHLLKTLLGKWGEVLWIFANGLDMTPVAADGDVVPIKSIGNSTTTPRDLVTDEDVKITLIILAESVAARLREHGYEGTVISICYRCNNLSSFTRQRKIHQPTQLASVIYNIAFELFKENYDWHLPLRSIGVRVTDLSSIHAPRQLSLFDEGYQGRIQTAGVERQAKLENALDDIRRRFGNYSIRKGLLLKDKYLAHLDPQKDHNVFPVGFVAG